MSPAPPIVLVHGAWFGGWCWSAVAAELRSHGHRVAAVDLPGRPGNPASPAEITLDSFVRHTLEVSRSFDEPAILVGHSLAGVTIGETAETDPDLVAALVFVSAFLLRDGEAAVEVMRRDPGSIARASRRLSADGSTSTVSPEMVREALCDDCSTEMVDEARRRLVAETVAIARTRVHWTEQRFGKVPRAYVECSRDRIISLAEQRAMVSAVGCDAMVTLETSHSPFLAMPKELASAILSAANSARSNYENRSEVLSGPT